MISFPSLYLLGILCTIASGSIYNRKEPYDIETRVIVTGPPCPEDTLITPCTCTYDNVTLEIFMDCSAVNDEAELRSVMSQQFSVSPIFELKIDHQSISSNLGNLTAGVFGENMFNRIHFRYTGVESIEESVYDNMADVLENIDLYSGSLVSFVLDFTGSTRLDSIFLNSNNVINEVNIVSSTVQYFEAAYSNSTATYTLDLPNAVFIDLDSNTFESVPNLSNSVRLVEIKLNFNNIQTLRSGDLCFSSDLMMVHIHDNGLANVEANSLCVATNSEVDLRYNEITTLNEAVWRSLVANVTDKGLYLTDNPLLCDCDVEWLFSQNFTGKISSGTTCANGTNIHDLNPNGFDSCN